MARGIRHWKYVLTRTVREFIRDQCTDLAAALTYFAVLALFPALLAIVSTLGLFGQAESTADAVFALIESLGGASIIDAVRDPVERLVSNPAAGWGFVIGVAGAIWSASGFVGAFGRAMNRMYGVYEGRTVWRLRPTQLAVTISVVLLVSIAGVLLVVSGPIARGIGDLIGLGEVAVTIWDLAKIPVLALIVLVIIALLYYVAPNVKHHKFRLVSLGALTALVIWAIASAGFGFYVSNFANYDRTYGTLGGVIVFLLWVWITNLALLLGAELDSELERGRQLEQGIRAEAKLRLPLKDDQAIDKRVAQVAKEIVAGREIRRQAVAADDAPPEMGSEDTGRSDITGIEKEKKRDDTAKSLAKSVASINAAARKDLRKFGRRR